MFDYFSVDGTIFDTIISVDLTMFDYFSVDGAGVASPGAGRKAAPSSFALQGCFGIPEKNLYLKFYIYYFIFIISYL